MRGFLAGVVRKRLKLKLGSKKVDGQRVYQIASGDSGKSARSPVQAPVVLIAMPRVKIGPAPPDRKTLDVEIARLRDLDVGELRDRWHTVFGGERRLTCPVICCSGFWRIGFRRISWVTWMPRAGACSIARDLPSTPDSVPWT